MTQLRTGIDFVDTHRVAELIDELGDTFMQQTWTEEEIAECQSDVERLAARFAAKEATIKALQSGLAKIQPKDIRIINSPNGAPEIQLTGTAATQAQELGLAQWSVSLTHDAGLAAAVVVALGVD